MKTKQQKNQEARLNKPFFHEGGLLVKIRNKHGLTQGELSLNLHTLCTSQVVSNTERGIAGLPLEAWANLIKKDLTTKTDFLFARSLDLEKKLDLELAEVAVNLAENATN